MENTLSQQQLTPQQDNTTMNFNSSLEDILNQMAINNLQFQQTINCTCWTTSNFHQSYANSRVQKSSFLHNTNLNVSGITLRSCKEVDSSLGTCVAKKNEWEKIQKKEEENKPTSALVPVEDDEQAIPLSFPQRVVKSKKMDQEDKEREIFPDS